MFIDRGMLRYGAADSGVASEHAEAGAEHLAGAASVGDMFGDFPEAAAMHEAVVEAHTHHADAMKRHQQILGDIAEKARFAEERFVAMDESNAQALRRVRCT